MPAERISHDEFSKMDLRGAEVLEAADPPNAHRLLVLKVQTGTEVRQVVAGIKAGYAPADLKGRRVILVANLAPAVIRGVESQGMLLAASLEGGQAVLLQPDREVPSGTVVR